MSDRIVYVGVDPGVSGGIACVDATGALVEVFKMPETEGEILNVIQLIGRGPGGSHVRRAVLERVNPGVFGAGKDGQRMGVVSAFTFGRTIGLLRMALLASEIPFEEVMPVTWQTALGCRSRGDKNVTKSKAQQLFSYQKVTHATADALLLAEYCRRFNLGLVARPPAPKPKPEKRAGRRDTELF